MIKGTIKTIGEMNVNGHQSNGIFIEVVPHETDMCKFTTGDNGYILDSVENHAQVKLHALTTGARSDGEKYDKMVAGYESRISVLEDQVVEQHGKIAVLEENENK